MASEETPLQQLQKKCLVKWRPLQFVSLDGLEDVDLHDPVLSVEPFVSEADRNSHEYQAVKKWPQQDARPKRSRKNWAETSLVNQIAYQEAKTGLEPRQRHMIQAVLEEGHTRKEAGAQIGLKPSQAGSVAKEAAEVLWSKITASGTVVSSVSETK